MSPILRNILLVVVVLALGVVVYYFFFTKDEPLITTGGSSVLIENQDLLTRLQKLQSISLDTGVLNDERFLSLQNFRAELEDEPTGRPNPFKPVGQ